ncbi:related to acetylxylan esterase [Ustilago sp. UG-2017a]|nr:related to acetylxylan esterase [Ustilago sp. UG-2017a]
MRYLAFQLLTASLLVIKLASAQGLPPAPGGPKNPVDPLASGQYWNGLELRPHWASPGGQPGAPPSSFKPGLPSPAAKPLPKGLQLESGFPGQPTKAVMYTYVPKTFKKGNPILVALHHCGGTGPGYYGEYPDWPKTADQKGFLIVYPSSPGDKGDCWDVSSKASLKHDGGGDSQTIVEMVKYAKEKYGCNDHQVYMVGHSSGAMMVQALGAAYPDVFLAGAEYSGVPANCFRTGKLAGNDWNSTCTGNTLHESTSYWIGQAKEMFPSYKGSMPRMMLVHGKNDQVIGFNQHTEAVKQWCGLHNLDPSRPTKVYKLPDAPNYVVSVYGSDVIAIAADGVTHDNPAKVDLTAQFFGL